MPLSGMLHFGSPSLLGIVNGYPSGFPVLARNDIIFMPLTMRALEAKGGPALL